jgi:hypothetical protein
MHIRSYTPNVPKPLRRAIVVLLGAMTLLVVGTIVAEAVIYREASKPSTPISEREAIADALKLLPDNGAGFTVLAAQLEPAGPHYEFADANGSMGGGPNRECLRMFPLQALPFAPCRYYPVWVIDVTSPSCNHMIAFNALTGRFDGGGSSGSSSAPSCSPMVFIGVGGNYPDWWQPFWR